MIDRDIPRWAMSLRRWLRRFDAAASAAAEAWGLGYVPSRRLSFHATPDDVADSGFSWRDATPEERRVAADRILLGSDDEDA